MNGEAVETGVEHAAADIIDDDVDPVAAGQIAHLMGEIIAFAGDDHLIRANSDEEVALGGASGGGDHTRAGGFGALHARNTAPDRSPCHPHRPAARDSPRHTTDEQSGEKEWCN